MEDKLAKILHELIERCGGNSDSDDANCCVEWALNEIMPLIYEVVEKN